MNASSFLLCKSKTDVVGLTVGGFAKADSILITEKSAIYIYEVSLFHID